MQNKVCVITGAGGVLCAAFAKEMAKNGYSVALLDINKDAAERVADDIIVCGGLAKAYYADVLDKECVEGVRKRINAELGNCTVLINGAGGNSPMATTTHEYFEPGDEKRDDILTFFNLDKSGFDFVFDLNIKGVLIPTQIFTRDMLDFGGCSVINISSMHAYRPLTKIPAYSAAKAAVSNLTQWLAVYFAKSGIRVNAISPGFISAAQNKALLWNEDGSPTATGKILSSIPMDRFGEPEELLGALKFLTDPDMSSYVTGVVIPIDGGFSAFSGV